MSGRIQSFEEFWPFYLGEHSRSATRGFHFVGTNLGITLGILAFVSGRPALLGLGLVLAYAMAWVSHFFIEKNRPATFNYPLWSFFGDFRMWSLMWTGRMHAELHRLGIAD